MTADEEENAVRQLGELIGYGRLIALAHNLRIDPKPVDLSRGSDLVLDAHPDRGKKHHGDALNTHKLGLR